MSDFVPLNPQRSSFSKLIDSRREWIDTVLVPWCQQANVQDLLQAEQNWTDLAGTPHPEKTLWYWAWSRFPILCEAEFLTLNETELVTIEVKSGDKITGYPDVRQSRRGKLILISESGEPSTPYSLDSIADVQHPPA